MCTTLRKSLHDERTAPRGALRIKFSICGGKSGRSVRPSGSNRASSNSTTPGFNSLDQRRIHFDRDRALKHLNRKKDFAPILLAYQNSFKTPQHTGCDPDTVTAFK